ncbi:DUF4236 domain-containing protein [Saccharopolyspora griseoalba]|uniref:DUF4236 domain-containing protein n=1 Tax=Saccharopolyspora griseoalba TaxID=1431848 RepID=A0ABW2LQR6_9PSEU
MDLRQVLKGLKYRKSIGFRPVAFNFGKRGLNSVSLRHGRWSWNSRTRRHTINLPVDGVSWQSPATPKKGQNRKNR